MTSWRSTKGSYPVQPRVPARSACTSVQWVLGACSCAEVAVTHLWYLQLLLVVSSCLCYPVGLTGSLWWLSSLVQLWNCWERLIQAGPSMGLVPVFPGKASSWRQGGRPGFHCCCRESSGVLNFRSWPRETVELWPEISTELVFYPTCVLLSVPTLVSCFFSLNQFSVQLRLGLVAPSLITG